jgi:hypothetical protein
MHTMYYAVNMALITYMAVNDITTIKKMCLLNVKKPSKIFFIWTGKSSTCPALHCKLLVEYF